MLKCFVDWFTTVLLLVWCDTVKKILELNLNLIGSECTHAHPFLTITTMAPSRRMRTTRPPAQAPRISPMSSACWDTSRARLWSLQATESERQRVNLLKISKTVKLLKNLLKHYFNITLLIRVKCQIFHTIYISC